MLLLPYGCRFGTITWHSYRPAGPRNFGRSRYSKPPITLQAQSGRPRRERPPGSFVTPNRRSEWEGSGTEKKVIHPCAAHNGYIATFGTGPADYLRLALETQ